MLKLTLMLMTSISYAITSIMVYKQTSKYGKTKFTSSFCHLRSLKLPNMICAHTCYCNAWFIFSLLNCLYCPSKMCLLLHPDIFLLPCTPWVLLCNKLWSCKLEIILEVNLRFSYNRVIICWRIFGFFLEDWFEDYIFCKVKYTSFHNTSFALRHFSTPPPPFFFG